MSDKINHSSGSLNNELDASETAVNANDDQANRVTAPIYLGNYINEATQFTLHGFQQDRVIEQAYIVDPYSCLWVSGWQTGPERMVTVRTKHFSKSYAPFLSVANFTLFKQLESGDIIQISCNQSVNPQEESSLPQSTAILCLGNYISRSTKFIVQGSKQGVIVEQKYIVKPYEFAWIDGWETGNDKMLIVQTNGGQNAFQAFAPLQSNVNFALVAKEKS